MPTKREKMSVYMVEVNEQEIVGVVIVKMVMRNVMKTVQVKK